MKDVGEPWVNHDGVGRNSHMRVILMAHTPDPDWLCTIAGRTCYSPLPMHDIEQGEKGCEAWLADKIERGHESVLEHASFTFSIEGASRALTHQLVRHRIASYSQQSQRYVGIEDFKAVYPQSIMDEPDALLAYNDALFVIQKAYKEMVKAGVPKEDARYILPNATCTNIVVTMNGRELRHFFELRLCSRAQWEIRELASLMLTECRRVAPGLFHNAGPKCHDCVQPCKNPFVRPVREVR